MFGSWGGAMIPGCSQARGPLLAALQFKRLVTWKWVFIMTVPPIWIRALWHEVFEDTDQESLRIWLDWKFNGPLPLCHTKSSCWTRRGSLVALEGIGLTSSRTTITTWLANPSSSLLSHMLVWVHSRDMLGFVFIILWFTGSQWWQLQAVCRHARRWMFILGVSLGDILEGYAVAPWCIRGGGAKLGKVIGEELGIILGCLQSTPDTSPPCLDGKNGKGR